MQPFASHPALMEIADAQLLNDAPTSRAFCRDNAEAPHSFSFFSPGGSFVLEISLRKVDFIHSEVSEQPIITSARGYQKYTIHPKLNSYVSMALLAHSLIDSIAKGLATELLIH